jgi:hypothetical protein
MSPDISEFSYGFALVDELIHWQGMPITAVPVYPSLNQEGNLGYDVAMDRGGIPLFLQFKLSDYMVRRSAIEVQNGLLEPPFYRMHLRSLKHSQQHPLLLKLEQAGNEVYYVAPLFHQPSELNDAYKKHEIKQRSRFFKPSDIGVITDKGRHHVSFANKAGFVFCSEPVWKKGGKNGKAFDKSIAGAINERGKTALNPIQIEMLLRQIKALLPEHIDRAKTPKAEALMDLEKRVEAIGQIAYLARTFLGCDMLIARNRPQPQGGNV